MWHSAPFPSQELHMSYFKNGLISLVLFGLVGCATTKQPLSDSGYSSSSKEWYAVNKCGMQGHLSAENVSLGRTYINSSLDRYQYDPARLSSELDAVIRSGWVPTKEDCFSTEVVITSIKQKIQISNQNTDSEARQTQEILNNSKVRNTYCNKIGTQTFCNTY